MSNQDKFIIGIIIVLGIVLLPAVFSVPYLTEWYRIAWSYASANIGAFVYFFIILVMVLAWFFDLPHSDFMESVPGIVVFIAFTILAPFWLKVPFLTNWYLEGWGWMVTAIGSVIATIKRRFA